VQRKEISGRTLAKILMEATVLMFEETESSAAAELVQ